MKVRPADVEGTTAASEEVELANPELYFHRLTGVLEHLPLSAIEEAVDRLFHAYIHDNAVYVFGNGGSAALASHVACDLGKGTAANGNRLFRATSLTDNVALITAWANDSSYEDIFAAQLRPLIRPGDIAFGISGSGNSLNVLGALHAARTAGAFNIGLTGFQGGNMKPLCDLCITVPSDSMQQIEDSHLCVTHAIFLSLRNLIRNADLPPVARAGM